MADMVILNPDLPAIERGDLRVFGSPIRSVPLRDDDAQPEARSDARHAVRRRPRRQDTGPLDLGDYARWLPIVASLRPGTPWPDVARILSDAVPGRRWTTKEIVHAVRRLVADRLADESLLSRKKTPRP
jgi:hypothetical protein